MSVMKMRIFLVFACLPLIAQTVTVPFVGCRSDGQVGPLEAPKGARKKVPLSAGAAQRLAWYEAANGYGVLGPRGWNCFGVYGSNGESLFVSPFVSPTRIDEAKFFEPGGGVFDGSAIQVSVSYGGTSGRFEVASIIARVFPSHHEFAESVFAEGFGPDRPANGPWPDDKLRYLKPEVVEYVTPPHKDGLGTASRLVKNDQPIRGVAILAGEDTDLLHLSLRLPPEFASLETIIIRQLERDAAHSSDSLSSKQ
jgi:hypothetical protein